MGCIASSCLSQPGGPGALALLILLVKTLLTWVKPDPCGPPCAWGDAPHMRPRRFLHSGAAASEHFQNCKTAAGEVTNTAGSTHTYHPTYALPPVCPSKLQHFVCLCLANLKGEAYFDCLSMHRSLRLVCDAARPIVCMSRCCVSVDCAAWHPVPVEEPGSIGLACIYHSQVCVKAAAHPTNSSLLLAPHHDGDDADADDVDVDSAPGSLPGLLGAQACCVCT